MVVVARQSACPLLEESREGGVAARLAERFAPARASEVRSNGNDGDAALAGLAVAGDRVAQRTLFRRLKGALHALLYRVLGANTHMEELLQKTFLSVFRALPFYRGEEPLTLWAERIALRVAGQHLREQRTLEGAADAPSMEPGPSLRWAMSTHDGAQHRRGVARLYEQLRRLGPEHQIAFALFELDARSLEELAALTGVSSAQAERQVTRARARLWDAARFDAALARCLREMEAGQR